MVKVPSFPENPVCVDSVRYRSTRPSWVGWLGDGQHRVADTLVVGREPP